MTTYFLHFACANRVSTAFAKSGLSSTMLNDRMCSKLCSTVSSNFTTGGLTRASDSLAFFAEGIADGLLRALVLS